MLDLVLFNICLRLLSYIDCNCKYYLFYKDYKASVEFMWAPFLVQQSITRENKRILRLDSVGKNGIYWKGVDVLVFETSHWWHQVKGVS